MKPKKIILLILAIFVISISIFYLKSFHITVNSQCPFCSKKVIEYQKYLETDKIYCLYNYRPLIKGHTLFVPKRHVQRLEELDESELKEIFEAIKKTDNAMKKILNVQSYIIIQKNGKDVGQTVPHLHFHYIPNKKEGSNFSFLMKFLLYPFNKKINEKEMSEMKELISKNLE